MSDAITPPAGTKTPEELNQAIKEAAEATSKLIEAQRTDALVERVPPKSGYLTSEFHLSSVLTLVGSAAALLGIIKDTPVGQSPLVQIATILVGAITAIASTLGYTASRTAVKK